MDKGDFNQDFECTSPICWSKYTTPTLTLIDEQEEKEGEKMIKKENSECKDEKTEDREPTAEFKPKCEFCGKTFPKRRSLSVRGHS